MDDGVSIPVVKVRLVHVTDGRARLRLAERLEDSAVQALANRLAMLPGARRVRVRPNTGSVIIEADADEAALDAALNNSAAIRILPPEKPIQVGQAAQLGLMKLDYEIRESTEGALDFRSALGVLLLAGAAVQLARGRIAGPATTLLLSALSFLETRPKG